MRYGKSFFFAVTVGLVTAFGYGVRSAEATPSSQTIYTYFEDGTYVNAVGEGATSCSTGKFQMLWGCKTPYYLSSTEDCSYEPPWGPAW